MKLKLAISLLMGGCTLAAMAQGGYQDGVDYFNADRAEQAKIILNKTINDANTDRGTAYYYLGAIDMLEGNTAAAKANFERGMAADPACGLNYVGLGEIALKGGDKKGAETFFKDAIKMSKKNPDISVAVARAYFNTDPVAYAKEIDKNVAQALKDSKNMAPSVYVLQGDMAAAKGDINMAAAYYDQALQFSTDAGRVNPEAYVKYANLYRKFNQDYAIGKLRDLKAAAPTSALAQRELAEKYYDAEKYSDAVREYREYMANPNHFQQDESRLSQLLYFNNENEESLKYAKSVLAQDPGNFYMYRMVMLNDAALKNLDEAAEYGAKLFKTAPAADLTRMDYNTYAGVLEDLNRPAEAVAIYEQGYAANPERNRSMLSTISSLYNDMEDYTKAAEYQQKYVDSGEPSLNDLFTLGRRYYNLALSYPEGSADRVNSATKGAEYVNKAIANAAPESLPVLYSQLATLVQVKNGKIDQEVADTYTKLLEVLDVNPENKTNRVNNYKQAYSVLASFYTDKKDTATARKYYELLYELDPTIEGLAKFLGK